MQAHTSKTGCPGCHCDLEQHILCLNYVFVYGFRQVLVKSAGRFYFVGALLLCDNLQIHLGALLLVRAFLIGALRYEYETVWWASSDRNSHAGKTVSLYWIASALATELRLYWIEQSIWYLPSPLMPWRLSKYLKKKINYDTLSINLLLMNCRASAGMAWTKCPRTPHGRAYVCYNNI